MQTSIKLNDDDARIVFVIRGRGGDARDYPRAQ